MALTMDSDIVVADTIASLRIKRYETVQRWTVAQIRAITGGVWNLYDIDTVALHCGLPVETVQEIVGSLGTWIRNVVKQDIAQPVTAGSIDVLYNMRRVPVPPRASFPRIVEPQQVRTQLHLFDVEPQSHFAVEIATAVPAAEVPLKPVRRPRVLSPAAAQKAQELRTARELVKAREARVRSLADETTAKLTADGRKVIVPIGFEARGRKRRDVRQALANIVVSVEDETLSDELIMRYLARQFPVRTQVLTYSVLATVWKFSLLGRFADIGAVNATDQAFQETIVDAFDTINDARSSALDGIRELLDGADGEEDLLDPSALAASAVKCRWLAEGEIVRLERSIALALAGGDKRLLSRALRSFAVRVRATPVAFSPNSISALNEMHILRIAQAAGLPTESDRAIDRQVRERLIGLGFSTDLDQLVPQGVRSVLGGYPDAFFHSLEARRDGDPEWESVLRRAMADA